MYMIHPPNIGECYKYNYSVCEWWGILQVGPILNACAECHMRIDQLLMSHEISFHSAYKYVKRYSRHNFLIWSIVCAIFRSREGLPQKMLSEEAQGFVHFFSNINVFISRLLA